MTLRRMDNVLIVVEALDDRPIHLRIRSATHREPDDARADAERLGDRAVRTAEQPLLAEDLPRISHRQSLGGHGPR